MFQQSTGILDIYPCIFIIKTNTAKNGLICPIGFAGGGGHHHPQEN